LAAPASLPVAAQCRIALAAEPHRHAIFADWLWVAQHIRKLDELALMRAAALGPELPHDLDILARALAAALGFGGKPPKKSGFRRRLAGSKMPKEGSKMPKETFFTVISRWRVVSRRALDASGFWQG